LNWDLHRNFQHKLHGGEAQGEAVEMSTISGSTSAYHEGLGTRAEAMQAQDRLRAERLEAARDI
jgi:hypothetical protein